MTVRLLQVTPSLPAPLGGGERYVLNLRRAVNQASGEGEVCRILSCGGETPADGADVLPGDVAQPDSFDPAALDAALLGADIVHVHQCLTRFGLFVAARARLLGRVVIGTDHGGGQARFLNAQPHLMALFHAVQTYSAFGDLCTYDWPVACERILGPVDDELFTLGSDTGRDPALVVSVGRILPHKGFETVIDALPPGLKLVIAGPLADLDYAAFLRGRAAGRAVGFEHALDDAALLALLQRAGLSVQVSTHRDYLGRTIAKPELLGLAPLEAMCTGLPTIVSAAGSLGELGALPGCTVAALPGDLAALLGRYGRGELPLPPGPVIRQAAVAAYGLRQFGERYLAMVRKVAPVRVLIVSNLFPPAFIGGYELAAQDVAVMLAARGHSVTVLCSAALDGQADPPTPFTVLRTLECLVAQIEIIAPEDLIHRGLGLNLRNLAALARAVETARPDVILCFNLAGLGPLGLLALFGRAGPPAVLMLMDNPFVFAEQDPALVRRLRRLLGLAAGLGGVTAVSCSESLTREISAITGDALDLPVIPAWTTTAAPPPRAHDGPVRFVFASRIAAHKGMMLAVEAAALVQARGVAFTLDVWGAGSPAEMMQAAHAAGLGARVRYRGLTTKQAMVEHFADYDALLFPTWEREPFGFVPVEAAAAGCVPIITGTIGGAEFMLDGLHCIKVRRTAVDLADAMGRLGGMAPAERLALRRRVRQHARRMFDSERWFNRFETVLQDTIAGDRRRVVPMEDAVLALSALAHIWRSSDG